MSSRSSTSSSRAVAAGGARGLFARAALGAALLVALQGAIARVWPPDDTVLHGILEGVVAHPARVVYLGDSVLLAVDRGDADRRSLARMEKMALAPIALQPAALHGMHAEIYEPCIDWLLRRGARPELFVVPITMRSLAPIWRFQPGLQFANERLAIAMDRPVLRWFLRPARIWQAQARWQVSEHDYRTTRVPTPGGGTATIAGRFDEHLAGRYDRAAWAAADYLPPVEPDHPRLRALVRIARRPDTRVLFYLTPTDRQSARALLGPVFDERFERNVATIVGALREVGADVIDWSGLLPTDAFTRSQVIDEHLDERGRRELAARLADEIRARLSAREGRGRSDEPGVSGAAGGALRGPAGRSPAAGRWRAPESQAVL